MAGLAPYTPACFTPEVVETCFRFQINGTSNPDVAFPSGQVVSVTRTGAGAFDVVLPAHMRYSNYVGLTGTVQGDSGATLGLVVQNAVTDWASATGTLTVYTVDTYTDATPAAADPTDDDWVFVKAVFLRRNTLAASEAI